MAHGSTQAAALESVNQALTLWLDTAKEFGDPMVDETQVTPPYPRTPALTGPGHPGHRL